MTQSRASLSTISKRAEIREVDLSSLRDSLLDGDRGQRNRALSLNCYPSGGVASVHPSEILYAEGTSRQLVYTSNVQEEDGLRDLTIRLLNAREEERSRVARELHDDLSQRMALLSIRLAQIVPMIEGRSDVRRRLHFVQKDAQEIATDIHRLSYKLHPSKLDYLGLSAAIGGLCQEVNATGKPAVEFHEQGSIADLPKEVTLCVFRIAQEALRNCAKHSGAKLARVTLVNTGKGTRLSVSDNGCGFEIKPETMESGLGFTSMRERLRIVGGTLTVRSQPARGTSIDVSIPLMWSTF